MSKTASHYAISRIELLELIIHENRWPTDLGEEVLKNLKLFCKYSNPELGIRKCSLNTLKSSVKAAIVIDEESSSWEYFKRKVHEAIDVICLSKNPMHKEFKRGSKNYYKAQRDEARFSNTLLVNDIVRLSDQYFNLVNICQIHSRKDKELRDDFFKHLDKYKKSKSQLTLVKKGS